MSVLFRMSHVGAIAVGAYLCLAVVPVSSAQSSPQFQCPPGLESAGDLVDRLIVINGSSGHVVLDGPGGCVADGGGTVGTPYIDLGTVTMTATGGGVSFQDAGIDAMNLPEPASVELRYHLAPVASGTAVFSNPIPFAYPLLPNTSASGLAPGLYNVSLTASHGIPVLDGALGQIEIPVTGPVASCLSCPTNWSINTSQTWQQAFGFRFGVGSGGNRTIALQTTVNQNSPIGVNNQIRSYAFTITDEDDGYGQVRALQHEAHGGTQWFWISKGESFSPVPDSGGPGDVTLLGYNLTPGQNGIWNNKCVGYGTANLAWATTDVGLPSGVLPLKSQRCILERNQPYYLNVGFYNLQQLVTTKTHINSCVRPPTNPSTWTCTAFIAGYRLEEDEPVVE